MKTAFGTALLCVMAMAALAPSEANAAGACRDGATVAATQLDQWNAASCDVDNVRVLLPDGRTADVPAPGWAATASVTVAAGYDPVPDVTIARALDGAITVVIGEPGAGDARTFGDATADAAQAPEAVSRQMIVAPMAADPRCRNYSYNIEGPKWIQTYKWYLKSGIVIPQASVAGGIDAMANGVGACSTVANSATASYQGLTTKSATITTGNLCTGTDSANVVDGGMLPSGTLAATCSYRNSSEISYADVRINTGRYSWHTGSATSCSGSRYDAQGVMAHEAGHVFGLGHVANSTNQVMKTNSGTCETTQRLLGAGNLAGMKYLYP